MYMEHQIRLSDIVPASGHVPLQREVREAFWCN